MEISRSDNQVLVELTHDDLTAAAASQAITLTDALPKGHVVDRAFLEVSEAFDGTTPTIIVKDADDEYIIMNTAAISPTAAIRTMKFKTCVKSFM